ncbi:hypothetical protein EIP91_000743 [Steccherinum ochraceum]|uniref:GRIP domain-containing protein n=1 Tax=Steccherinum ochraceum TaxID=92696 RepID=A0A4R0RVT7_9APHY|nr:hypothetical protein EIP91_000743 [Steccherinum ochraceum]
MASHEPTDTPRRTSSEESDSRRSFDSERLHSPPPPTIPNGINGKHEEDDAELEGMDPIQRLQHELHRTKEEKEALAAQYRNLLSKLTAMRQSLGNKLKQDAEELDRQEQLVHSLTAQNEDLAATVETLKAELISSNEEAERASRELEVMRSRALQENAQEAYQREREVRELQADLEQCRIERDEWEGQAMQSQVVSDEVRSTVETLRRDLEIEREAREHDTAELRIEREKCSNLQSVLEDFQSAKDHELKQAIKEHETQLLQITQSLAEFKHRAITAEMELEESNTSSSRTVELEKEVKEKNLLISKLRHEAVIMNDHLMEALRRLRRSSSDTNVDRRLVTNVLLSFLVTPRADPKRFEMLSLLSSILSWNDDEREKAGLQRKGGALPSTGSSIWGRATSPKGSELEKGDETESFSRLWVEFLLTEAAAGELVPPPPRSPSRGNSSLPASPRRPSFSPSHLSPTAPRTAPRLPSFSSVAAMASSPNLVLQQAPLGKGKEKATDLSPS